MAVQKKEVVVREKDCASFLKKQVLIQKKGGAKKVAVHKKDYGT